MRIIALVVVVVNFLLPFFLCYITPGETKALKELQELPELKRLKEFKGHTPFRTESDVIQNQDMCSCSSSNRVTSDPETDKIDDPSSGYTNNENAHLDSEIQMDFKEINIENELNFNDKEENDPNVIKQVIFIEPPQYIYKHQISFQQPKMQPRTVIYVLPPEVKHEYNVTDTRTRAKPSEPIVYYLTMKDLLEMQEQLISNVKNNKDFDKIPNESYNKVDDNIKDIRTDGFNQSDPRIGTKRNLEMDKSVDKNVEKNNSPIPVEHSKSTLISETSLNKFETDLISTRQFQNIENRDDTDTLGYSSPKEHYQQQQSNFYTDNISEETQENDFEIIPAILQRYFYIGPDAHLYEDFERS